MIRLALVCLLIGSLLLGAVPAFAFDFDQIQINGFVSQGYLQSEGNNIFTADSTDGSFQFNEIGLTINSDITENLHVGLQLLARDLGDEGNDDAQLDWAYGDYRFVDYFGVRVGKIKLPIGLYNEGRDTDILRPMVFLPQSLYDEMRRDIVNTVVGAGIYGHIPAGAAGSFQYKLVYGEIDIPSGSFFSEFFPYWINRRLVTAGAPAALQKLDYNSNFTVAASLVYITPIKGLRVGFSAIESDGEFDTTFNAQVPPATLGITDTTIKLNLKNFYVFSAEYTAPYATLSAEYYQLDRTVAIFGDLVENSVPEAGGYLMASVPLSFAPGLSVNGVYDLYYDDMDRRNWRTWSKDRGAGLRYDVNEHWTLKGEFHDVNGGGRTYSSFNQTGAVKDWSYWLIKTSFNF